MKKVQLILMVLLGVAAMMGCSHSPEGVAADSASPSLDRIVQRGELVVGTAASMPPMNMTTAAGEVIGLEVDIANLIAAGMGVRLRLEVMPFSELLPALEAQKVDMVLSNMTMTPQRNLKVGFVGPYFTSGKAFLTKEKTIANAKTAGDINTPDTHLAALKGSTSQYFVQELIPKAQLTLADDYDQGVQMVINDQVHALVADYPICVVSVFRYPDKGLVSLITPLTYEPIGIAVAPQDPLLFNWLGNFLDSMRASGRLDELEARWLDNAAWINKLP